MVEHGALAHEKLQVLGLARQLPLHDGMGDLRDELVHTVFVVRGSRDSRQFKCGINATGTGIDSCVHAAVYQTLRRIYRSGSFVLVGVTRPVRSVVVLIGTEVEATEAWETVENASSSPVRSRHSASITGRHVRLKARRCSSGSSSCLFRSRSATLAAKASR